MNKTIYDLKLHEELVLDGMTIIRVAGGWLYRFMNGNVVNYTVETTFVPFNNEFQATDYNDYLHH